MAIKQSLYDAFSIWCEDAGISGDRLENYFFKTLMQRHPELQSSRRTVDGRREHCLVGIDLKQPLSDEDSRLQKLREKIKSVVKK